MASDLIPLPLPDLPAAYLGYFERFNRGEFFEAHEVLEELWLDVRLAPEGDFYKGLIQFAGVFVHLERGRRTPAAALCRRALVLLSAYRPRYERLDVDFVCDELERWEARIASGEAFASLLAPSNLPVLRPDSTPAT